MMEHDLTLQPRQQPDCKSGSDKFCSIHHIVLMKYRQISTSVGHLRTFYQENDFRTKRHCKKQLCNTSHPLERNTTMKECLNL
jgi:hypothetical protein